MIDIGAQNRGAKAAHHHQVAKLTWSPARAEWLCCFLGASAVALPPDVFPPDFPLPPAIVYSDASDARKDSTGFSKANKIDDSIEVGMRESKAMVEKEELYSKKLFRVVVEDGGVVEGSFGGGGWRWQKFSRRLTVIVVVRR